MLEAANPSELVIMHQGPGPITPSVQVTSATDDLKGEVHLAQPMDPSTKSQVLIWRSIWDIGD